MAKLWKKKGQKINPLVEKYTAGTDYLFDVELMPFDIAASRAHAKGLKKIGVLNHVELSKILKAFDALEKDFAQGKIAITPADEDCHTVIENYLVKKTGVAGKKIHTGRSRNDQVLVATRLYMKSHLGKIRLEALALAEDVLAYAEKYQDVPMPGYTHTQQAMLSSVGHYVAGLAESLVDDAAFANCVMEQIDANPLGSAAGFGTSFPVDRAFTAKEMGFVRVQVNSLYAQNSRGKFESAYLEALAQIMLTLGRFAHDMILFTSQEFDYFALDQSLVTGSSIMPQKRNPDLFEIMRGNVSVVIGNQLMVKDIGKNLLSGYHRDLQLIKKPVMESTQIVAGSIAVARLALAGLAPKPEILIAKLSPGIFAADIANDLVKKKGLAFRDAYQEAMTHVGSAKTDPMNNLKSKISLGAPGNLDLKGLHARLKKDTK